MGNGNGYRAAGGGGGTAAVGGCARGVGGAGLDF